MNQLRERLSALRVYEPEECGKDGYPLAWHDLGDGQGVKHLVRELAGYRCVRCSHPYRNGEHGNGEWSLCDTSCSHRGPTRLIDTADDGSHVDREHDLATESGVVVGYGKTVMARWRILTVHHLRLGDDAKRDLRWWNLAALCQRCHLTIQGKVVMERIWPWPHTEWFKPYAAGWYAWAYLGEHLTRDETMARLDELLALEGGIAA